MSPRPWHYHDTGRELIGEIYTPSAAPNGRAVLVCHEADGIGGNVRRHCVRLAELGYVAAAADLHGAGRVLPDAEIPAALARFRENPDLLRRRVRAALDALEAETGIAGSRIAAIGFCFGGMAVLEVARSGAEIAAVVSFHGLLTTQAPAQRGAVTARVLAATGARDPLVPPEDIAALMAEMAIADADWQLLVHGRALHSYTNIDVDKRGDPRMAYDAVAARQSWSAMVAFLEESFSGAASE